MNLRKYSTIENNVYIVRLVTEDWSETDKALMTRFGEPTVNLGGDFAITEPYSEFHLDDNNVRVMSDSPFVQKFDIRDYADAESRADTWKTQVCGLIAAAVEALRLQANAWVKEEVETV